LILCIDSLQPLVYYRLNNADLVTPPYSPFAVYVRGVA